MASLLTPCVAIGFQWITALCKEESSLAALISATWIVCRCIISGDVDVCLAMNQHCVLKT